MRGSYRLHSQIIDHKQSLSFKHPCFIVVALGWAAAGLGCGWAGAGPFHRDCARVGWLVVCLHHCASSRGTGTVDPLTPQNQSFWITKAIVLNTKVIICNAKFITGVFPEVLRVHEHTIDLLVILSDNHHFKIQNPSIWCKIQQFKYKIHHVWYKIHHFKIPWRLIV